MRKNKILILICLPVFIFCSCQNNKDMVKNNCNNFIADSETNLSRLPSDPFTLNTFYIAGSYLTASVSYSGGCEEHCFTLGWNEMIMESFPPQTVLILSQNSNNDSCGEYITENIRINISDFKEKLLASNIRDIVIKIENKTYHYKF